MPAIKPDQVYVLPREALSDDEAQAVTHDAVAAESDVAIVEVTGSGVLPCMQGILTNDLEGVGDAGVLYAALLTPKGMIVTDLWVTRTNGAVWLTVPAPGRDALLATFQKYLPPRLARPQDRTEDLGVIRIVGPRAVEAAAKAGINIPEPGRSSLAIAADTECLVVRPPDGAYFGLQVQVHRSSLPAIRERLAETGTKLADSQALDLARIIGGWPRLGFEINEKTLPQEVRFDENDGVSYTKGCYTGQETVARLHFRGHANRRLVGLIWDDQPSFTDPSISQHDNDVGRVTSIAWLAPKELFIGLGVVHRKADPGQSVYAASALADIGPLPFTFES